MGLKYTKMKVFHYKDKVDSLPPEVDKILPPIHIRIKPTNVCNHKCWYCAYKAKDMQLGKDMNESDFIPERKMYEIIEDIAEMGVKAVTFSGGGEPFCYPYLKGTVERLIKNKIPFASLTNGSRLDGDVAELFAHHAKWLRISLDGWDDTSYAEYRGIKTGQFTKVMKNMTKFKQFGGSCCLGVVLIVDKKNVSHLHDLVYQLKSVGVNSVKIGPCITSNIPRETNEYHKGIYDKARKQIDKCCEDYKDDSFEIYDCYHWQEEKNNKNYTWCPNMQVLTIIGADANVYACHDKAYNFDCGLLGSIKDVRFKDFWLNDKSKFFRIDPSKVCTHHCVDDDKNNLILSYLNADMDHLGFV